MSSLGDEVLKDIKSYCTENLTKIDDAAKDLMKKMKTEIKSDTPVGDGRDSGHLNSGWAAKAYGATGRRVGSDKYNGAVYAVRNTKKPTLVHLLNFPHEKVLWGKRVGGEVEPVMNMPEIRERYQEELDKEIERILGNG